MYKIIGADQKEYGPVSADQLRQWISEGRINAQTLVQAEGGQWMPASRVPEFAGLFVVAPPPVGSPPPFGSHGAIPPGTVPNYLVQSILVTLCCCLPLGVVAIVYASQVNSKLAVGDHQGAVNSSNNAKKWCWIAFGLGIVTNIIGFIVQFALMRHNVGRF